MLSYLYDLLMSIVTYVLGLFGIDMKKKSVSFADEGDKKEEQVTPAEEETKAPESS
jgi:hypothetical protein